MLDNALRETIGRFKCSELISSCALLQPQNTKALGKGSGDQTNANLIWKIADLLRGSTSRTSTAS